ncbi:MAG: hypothetical protein MJ112_04325 [Lachnospiraceae bacterium]|nr:hypothetical protein [Lachnospiraceae bacterium]
MSKVVRKLALALGLVGLIASLSGCGLKKTAITAEEFSSKMEDEGYQMVDITNQYEEVENALLAMNLDDGYKIEYYNFADEDSARTAYNQTANKFDKQYNVKMMSMNLTFNHSQSFYFTGQGKDADGNKLESYVHISRVDDTMILVVADKEYRDDIKAIIKELGY